MSMRRIAAVQAGLLLAAMFANAASRDTMRIKVLDSATRSASLGGNDVPKNCDQVNFDAYCNNSKTTSMTNTLLVQEGDGPPFRISCTIESRYSRCTPLPKGETFDARKEKHGITVYYVDDKGKARKQLYTLVDTGGKADSRATVAAVATQPVPAAAKNVGQGSIVPAPQAVAPVQSSPVVPSASAVSTQEALAGKVRCNFNSTPAGAEITIDWRYVGNTPSEIGLSPGTHVVVISMPGFAEWRRELAVAADSVVNVTANLQRTQP